MDNENRFSRILSQLKQKLFTKYLKRIHENNLFIFKICSSSLLDICVITNSINHEKKSQDFKDFCQHSKQKQHTKYIILGKGDNYVNKHFLSPQFKLS